MDCTNSTPKIKEENECNSKEDDDGDVFHSLNNPFFLAIL
jgi:hypothetical protein